VNDSHTDTQHVT